MMCICVIIDVDGDYAVLVAASGDILKFPVNISLTPHTLGQPTVFISGPGNVQCLYLAR